MQSKYLCYVLFFIALFLVRCKDNEDVNPSSKTVTPNDFLSERTYTSLTIEITYVEGFAPTTASVDHLKSFLQSRLNKSGGINIIQRSIGAVGKSSYSLSDLKNIEQDNRTVSTIDKMLTAHFFFADADYAANSGTSKVLGVAYGSSSMAIFEKTIKEFSGGIGKPSATVLESTVMNHEFSHILGLVNNGTTTQTSHQDTTHGAHCSAQDCLMSYQTETSDVVSNLIGGTIPVLDAACLADLKANGGK